MGAGLLLCRSQGHVDRGRGPGFKAHSDPGMATRPQTGQCQTHHRLRVQEAGGQGHGVVFPGSRAQLQQKFQGNLRVSSCDLINRDLRGQALQLLSGEGDFPGALGSARTWGPWTGGSGGQTSFTSQNGAPGEPSALWKRG